MFFRSTLYTNWLNKYFIGATKPVELRLIRKWGYISFYYEVQYRFKHHRKWCYVKYFSINGRYEREIVSNEQNAIDKFGTQDKILTHNANEWLKFEKHKQQQLEQSKIPKTYVKKEKIKRIL